MKKQFLGLASRASDDDAIQKSGGSHSPQTQTHTRTTLSAPSTITGRQAQCTAHRHRRLRLHLLSWPGAIHAREDERLRRKQHGRGRRSRRRRRGKPVLWGLVRAVCATTAAGRRCVCMGIGWCGLVGIVSLVVWARPPPSVHPPPRTSSPSLPALPTFTASTAALSLLCVCMVVAALHPFPPGPLVGFLCSLVPPCISSPPTTHIALTP